MVRMSITMSITLCLLQNSHDKCILLGYAIVYFKTDIKDNVFPSLNIFFNLLTILSLCPFYPFFIMRRTRSKAKNNKPQDVADNDLEALAPTTRSSSSRGSRSRTSEVSRSSLPRENVVSKAILQINFFFFSAIRNCI
jgi:hypothetical protein